MNRQRKPLSGFHVSRRFCSNFLTLFLLKFEQFITKTYLYNFDPLKPHFYIVKLMFTGVYIIFLISAQKYRLWYSLEPPGRGGSNEYPQSMFWAEIWNISEFLSENFQFLVVRFSIYFEQACFPNVHFTTCWCVLNWLMNAKRCIPWYT